ELEEQLAGGRAFREVDPPILPAHLAELARPERQGERRPLVFEAGIEGPLAPVVPRAREPAAGELVVARDVHPEGRHRAVLLLAPAPEQLRPPQEAAIQRALQ